MVLQKFSNWHLKNPIYLINQLESDCVFKLKKPIYLINQLESDCVFKLKNIEECDFLFRWLEIPLIAILKWYLTVHYPVVLFEFKSNENRVEIKYLLRKDIKSHMHGQTAAMMYSFVVNWFWFKIKMSTRHNELASLCVL